MSWKEYWKIRFSWKIHLEYWAYREEMLNRRADVIFERAYEIDMISNIYKHLLRMVDGLPDSCLRQLCFMDHVLLLFYKEWLSVDDDCNQQLGECMRDVISTLCGVKIYEDYREAV